MKWAVLGVKALLSVIVLLVLGACAYLYFAPPDLIRVATNYSAKITCSNFFIAGRNVTDVQNVDVQAGSHPILQYINIDVDEPEGVVTARLLGLFATGTAVFRDGLGCSSAPDGNIESVQAITLDNASISAHYTTSPWQSSQHNSLVDDALTDQGIVGEGMRAVVVIKDGKLLAETYGSGFRSETPLLGWSMAKSVTGLLMGIVFDQQFNENTSGLFPHWSNDMRENIRLADLMTMSSNLQWNEGYGSVSDVTRMLYLEPDMAKFASSLPISAPDTQNIFHYSSGTTILLSKILQDQLGVDALSFPHEKLFGPLGMTTAVLETDAVGTYAGSSYLYASARDWARIGQLIVNSGEWDGNQLVPTEYVNWMLTGADVSKAEWGMPEYGNAQIWMHGPRADTPSGENPDADFGFPSDTRWMLGHDGQSIAIVPSLGLVVVRMGLTGSHHNYKPQRLLSAIIKATEN